MNPDSNMSRNFEVANDSHDYDSIIRTVETLMHYCVFALGVLTIVGIGTLFYVNAEALADLIYEARRAMR
ncbi:MAG: hypothetical protein ACPG4X_16995 [Pikeienuella sp.]